MSKRYKMAPPPEGWEWVFDQGSGRRYGAFRLVTQEGFKYEEYDYFFPSMTWIMWNRRKIAKESQKIVKRLRAELRRNEKYPPDLDGYTFVPHLDPDSAAAAAEQAGKAGDVTGRAEA